MTIQAMLKQILAKGLSQKEVAERLSKSKHITYCSQPSVNRMLKGNQEPKYSLGKAVEELHLKTTKKKGK